MFEAATATRGLTEAGIREPNLLIIDLGQPGGSGLYIIREVRTWSGVPIVVLSARSDEKGKVAALDAGADDYLTKPFGNGELLAAPCAGQRRGPGVHAPPIAARSRGGRRMPDKATTCAFTGRICGTSSKLTPRNRCIF